MLKDKVLIDCDPGIDDTFALMLAKSRPDLDVIALTSCYGNNHIEQITENLLRVAEAFGFDCKVYPGAHKALLKPISHVVEFHGENGLGGVELPAGNKKAEKKYAWDAIYELAMREGQLKIITLGPLTNIAIALSKYEDLAQYISEIVIMGGSSSIGNERPFGEANVLNDPPAMKIVVHSGVKVTMVGLNATFSASLEQDEVEECFGHLPTNLSLLEGMLDHYKRIQEKYGDYKLVIHDLAAMAVAVKPDIADIRLLPVDVETISGPMEGRTIVDLRPYSTLKKNVHVVEKIDVDKYKTLIKESIQYFREKDQAASTASIL